MTEKEKIIEEGKRACYCTSLRRSAGLVSELYDHALQPAGLTAAQYSLLVRLERLGAANITRWAAVAELERSTMVRNIRVLESRGLVARTVGRGKVYAVSPQGKLTLETAKPLWAAMQEKTEQMLGADAAAILRVFDRLQKQKDSNQ